MKRIIIPLLVLCISAAVTGCGQNKGDSAEIEAAKEQVIDNINQAKEHDENYTSIYLDVINATNVDFGAVALMDPKTKEQIVLDGVEKQQSFMVEIDWPKDESEINWAIYTTSGELYLEGVTAIEEDKYHISLTMEGDDTIENVVTESTTL